MASERSIVQEVLMSVVKVVELIASSNSSFEDAVRDGIAKASESIRNIKGAWVSEQKVDVEGNQVVAFRVTLRISFLVD